jgi:rhodanese-related sulfurtransferase
LFFKLANSFLFVLFQIGGPYIYTNGLLSIATRMTAIAGRSGPIPIRIVRVIIEVSVMSVAYSSAAVQPSAPALPEELASIKADAQASSLPYAGGVPPALAWKLFSTQQVLLVDVRSNEERKFVGHVPGSIHVPWATGTALTRNPRFVRELESKIGGKEVVALLLCRSGKRSALAAEAAAKAGLTCIFNVLEGFEGEIDALQQRGKADGWRFHGLPWIQD